MIESTAPLHRGQFFEERRRTYHRFVVWSGVFLLHCVAILGLLAIFRS